MDSLDDRKEVVGVDTEPLTWSRASTWMHQSWAGCPLPSSRRILQRSEWRGRELAGRWENSTEGPRQGGSFSGLGGNSEMREQDRGMGRGA